ncbi:MAG: hypothetical protein DME18_13840 [Verrucomicrobia bacterium]|nr:MAG: hypothetical protein DME18_13840 [Verrucomicrobiota bacterium]
MHSQGSKADTAVNLQSSPRHEGPWNQPHQGNKFLQKRCSIEPPDGAIANCELNRLVYVGV